MALPCLQLLETSYATSEDAYKPILEKLIDVSGPCLVEAGRYTRLMPSSLP